jgi:hypothetical protein
MPHRFKLLFLVCVAVFSAAYGWTQDAPPVVTAPNVTVPSSTPDSANPVTPASNGESAVQPASLNGVVVDQSGAAITGARISIGRSGQTLSPDALSGTDGQFFFPSVSPGDFQLMIRAPGFTAKTFSGSVRPGETQTVPQLMMEVAPAMTQVSVALTRDEVAEEEMKVEEQQRILGIVPNFYVSYTPFTAPLSSKQKFRLAARSVIDPFTFFVVGASAGVEQADNHFSGYGQGTEGYAKRFGANFADAVSGTFIGGAILPSLLKQDPRYFYKGTGTFQERALYAIGMSVISKGDNGKWQPGYSAILGSLAAGGISNIYYPADDRNGAELTFENAAIGIVANAATNLLQEFVIRKFTPKARTGDITTR